MWKLYARWCAGVALATGGVEAGLGAASAWRTARDPVEIVVIGVDRSHAMAGQEQEARAALREVLSGHANDHVWIVTARRAHEGADAPLGRAWGARRLERIAARAAGIDAGERYVITNAGPEETMRLQGWRVVRP